jgi:hypothetical protein
MGRFRAAAFVLLYDELTGLWQSAQRGMATGKLPRRSFVWNGLRLTSPGSNKAVAHIAVVIMRAFRWYWCRLQHRIENLEQ